MDSFDIKSIVDRVADSGLLNDRELEALRYFVDMGIASQKKPKRQKKPKKPRTDPLNELIYVTCQNMMQKGQEMNYRDVIPELWRYEKNTIDDIESEIIYWIAKNGRSRKTSFDGFRRRFNKIIKNIPAVNH